MFSIIISVLNTIWQLSCVETNPKWVKKSLEQSSSSLVTPKSHHGYVVWDPVTIEIECNEALSFKSFIKRGIHEVFGWKTINLISRHLNLFTRYSDTTSTPAAVEPRRQPIGGFTFRIKNVTENQNSNTVVFTNFMTYKNVWKLEQIIFFLSLKIFSAFGFWGWPILQRRKKLLINKTLVRSTSSVCSLYKTVANRPKKSVWGCQCLAWFFVQRPSICRRPRDISISEKWGWPFSK